MNCPVLLFDLLEWREADARKKALQQLRKDLSEREISEIEAFLTEMSTIPTGHVVNRACAELQSSLIMAPDDGLSLGDTFAEMLRDFRHS